MLKYMFRTDRNLSGIEAGNIFSVIYTVRYFLSLLVSFHIHHALNVALHGNNLLPRKYINFRCNRAPRWSFNLPTQGYFVVIVLLFIVHGKQIWWCRGGRLTKRPFFWAGLDTLSDLLVLRAYSFTSSWRLPFLHQRKGANDCRKYFMINLI